VDAVGVLPMFMTFTQGIERSRLNRIIVQSVLTAAAVALAFLFAGPALLTLLGITVADFMIAGGILLFVLSMSDLVSLEKTQRKVDPESLGAVPIGVPLISGPAVLTTSILLVHQSGLLMTAAAVVVNILIAGLVFWFSEHINRILGSSGSKTVSKIAGLLLAAIAVMMIRKGIAFLIEHPAPT